MTLLSRISNWWKSTLQKSFLFLIPIENLHVIFKLIIERECDIAHASVVLAAVAFKVHPCPTSNKLTILRPLTGSFVGHSYTKWRYHDVGAVPNDNTSTEYSRSHINNIRIWMKHALYCKTAIVFWHIYMRVPKARAKKIMHKITI